MNNEPTYKINGIERRKVKKHLSELKFFVKDFWYYHNLDKDMYSFYSPNDTKSLMSDADAQILLNNKKDEILKIEKELNEPYKSLSDIRDEKIKKII